MSKEITDKYMEISKTIVEIEVYTDTDKNMLADLSKKVTELYNLKKYEPIPLSEQTQKDIDKIYCRNEDGEKICKTTAEQFDTLSEVEKWKNNQIKFELIRKNKLIEAAGREGYEDCTFYDQSNLTGRVILDMYGKVLELKQQILEHICDYPCR